MENKKMVLYTRKLTIAYHETGHAVMALICGRKIQTISLREKDSPRGTDKYLGFTSLEPFERKNSISGKEAIRKIMISLGGYASEVLFFGSSKIGGDDLTVATNLVEEMLKIEEFSNFVSGLPIPDPGALDMIENPLIRTYIDYRMNLSLKILDPYKREIQFMAKELYRREELTGDEFSALFNSFTQMNETDSKSPSNTWTHPAASVASELPPPSQT